MMLLGLSWDLVLFLNYLLICLIEDTAELRLVSAERSACSWDFWSAAVGLDLNPSGLWLKENGMVWVLRPIFIPLFCEVFPIPWCVGSLWSCCLHSCSSSSALWEKIMTLSFVCDDDFFCFSRGICTWIGQSPWILKWIEANIQQDLKGCYRKRFVLFSSLIWCESPKLSQTWLVLPHTQAFCRINCLKNSECKFELMILNLVVMVMLMNPFENMLRAMDHLHIVKYICIHLFTSLRGLSDFPQFTLGFQGWRKPDNWSKETWNLGPIVILGKVCVLL